jgi:hypothetical protein
VLVLDDQENCDEGSAQAPQRRFKFEARPHACDSESSGWVEQWLRYRRRQS